MPIQIENLVVDQVSRLQPNPLFVLVIAVQDFYWQRRVEVFPASRRTFVHVACKFLGAGLNQYFTVVLMNDNLLPKIPQVSICLQIAKQVFQRKAVALRKE